MFDLTNRGYRGVLKPLPKVSKDLLSTVKQHTSADPIAVLHTDGLNYYHPLNGLTLSYQLHACCGVHILNGMEGLALFVIQKSKDEEDHLGLVRTVPTQYSDFSKEDLLALFINVLAKTFDHWSKQNKGNKYILVSLNHNEIAAGIDDILVDYFGFNQLEADFKNAGYPKKTEYSRIRLLGLNFHEWQTNPSARREPIPVPTPVAGTT